MEVVRVILVEEPVLHHRNHPSVRMQWSLKLMIRRQSSHASISPYGNHLCYLVNCPIMLYGTGQLTLLHNSLSLHLHIRLCVSMHCNMHMCDCVLMQEDSTHSMFSHVHLLVLVTSDFCKLLVIFVVSLSLVLHIYPPVFSIWMHLST